MLLSETHPVCLTRIKASSRERECEKGLKKSEMVHVSHCHLKTEIDINM